MKVAIIGCGLIGRKRALALSSDDKLVACCDSNEEIGVNFAKQFSAIPFEDYKELLTKVECDTVIVAVVNKFAGEIVVSALEKGKHVLAEKPLGRNSFEASIMNEAVLNSPSGVLLRTGFNHRFHPSIRKAKEMVMLGKIGSIFNIRARYGHGGRAGMEKEWRASRELCGGGELLDQGVHIIDLIRWFGGDIKEIFGKVETKFWDMDVEDNACAILKTQNNVTATFSVSWTNWKNIFSFEIFGMDGYLKIEGLGGSYGNETLEFGKRKKEGGRPDIELFEFGEEDVSWKDEWMDFKCAIVNERTVGADGNDGLKANEVVEAIYQSSEKNSVIQLK